MSAILIAIVLWGLAAQSDRPGHAAKKGHGGFRDQPQVLVPD
jgi:hypothetical protein